MRKIGDYEWHSVSMWEFSPNNSIELYIKSGDHVFHYYLNKISSVLSNNQWKVGVVAPEEIKDVPDEILHWRAGEIYLKINGKSTPYIK